MIEATLECCSDEEKSGLQLTLVERAGVAGMKRSSIQFEFWVMCFLYYVHLFA